MSMLLTPGPVTLPPASISAMASQPLHHRSAEFIELSKTVWSQLQTVLCTARQVHIIPGGATTATEAAFASVTNPDDSVAILVHGRFGGRLVEIASKYKVASHVYEVPWGETIYPEEITSFLDTCPDVSSIWLVHTETSTGVTLELRSIATRVRQHRPDIIIGVDAVTSIAVEPCEMDAWGLDIVITGSQKGLMAPPGLGIVALSERASAAMSNGGLPTYNLHLPTVIASQEKGLFTWTPPTNLIAALSASLTTILGEGLENAHKRHAERAASWRSILESCGAQLFGDGNASGLVVIEHENSAEINKTLLDKHGVRVAGGQDEYSGRLIRIGTMGHLTNENVEHAQRAFTEVIAR